MGRGGLPAASRAAPVLASCPGCPRIKVRLLVPPHAAARYTGCSLKKILLLLTAAAVVLVLALTAVAQAATPQDLYDDFVLHGADLTGTYTAADLKGYLADAISVHGQGENGIAIAAKLDSYVHLLLNEMATGVSFKDALFTYSGHPPETEPPVFPRTGSELLIDVLGGFALIGGGLLLRRRGMLDLSSVVPSVRDVRDTMRSRDGKLP